MSKPITGREFARALEAAGVVSDLNTIERIIIDVSSGNVVKVHVQHIGDERLLDLAALLADCETGTGQSNPVARMTDAEFERHLRAAMRLNPGLIEQFLNRIARINGGRIPWMPRSGVSG